MSAISGTASGAQSKMRAFVKGTPLAVVPLVKHSLFAAKTLCDETEISRKRTMPNTPPRTSPRLRIVVVGNGLVGHRFVEDLRERDPNRELSITVIGEEPRLAYDRVHLSAYFEGKSADDLAVATRERYAELEIETGLG